MKKGNQDFVILAAVGIGIIIFLVSVQSSSDNDMISVITEVISSAL